MKSFNSAGRLSVCWQPPIRCAFAYRMELNKVTRLYITPSDVEPEEWSYIIASNEKPKQATRTLSKHMVCKCGRGPFSYTFSSLLRI